MKTALNALNCLSTVSAAATLRFDGKQFVKVTVPEESHTQAEDISLRFRTMHPNGLLFMTTSERAEDKMELYLKSGSIFLGVDVGSGHKVRAVYVGVVGAVHI